MMKISAWDKRFVYMAGHQVLTVVLTICVFAYDYLLRIQGEQNEIAYIIIGFSSLLGSIASLSGFTVTESHIILKKREKKGLDKVYIELVVLVGGSIVSLLFWLLLSIDVTQFTLPGLMISVGIMGYFIDAVLLICYNTIMHRIVKKQLKTDSFFYKCGQMLYNYEKGVGIYELSRKSQEQIRIRETLQRIAEGELDISLELQEFHGMEKEMAEAINCIQGGLRDAVEARMKDEKMKADLITNVSHDIKTPLTSIVNYVELLKREKLESETAMKYVHIISDKAQRLKTLTEDLVEVSRISSGNIQLDKQTIDFMELLYQTGGEFNEKFEEKNLTIITKMSAQSVYIEADGRQLYRVLENLYSNATKYSLENTTVYVELMVENTIAVFRIKNIAKYNIEVPHGDYSDLTERFVRGEISRTTEGSGLGLSIAKTLTVLMGGEFAIRVDRDMFMAQIKFPVKKEKE